MRDVEDSGRSELENLPRLIAKVVSRDPERVALVRDGAVVTYAGLNAELAALGAAMGDAIGPDALVPVVLTGLLPGLADTGPDDVAAALAELSEDLAAFAGEEPGPELVRPDTLPAAFAAQAAATPDAVAVEFDGVEYTYAELAGRSRRLARLLVDSGVGPGVTVAVALRRSFDLIVAVYAVLEAGGAYVPIDPDHPADRLTYILDVAEPAVLLTGTTVPVPAAAGIEVLDLSTLDLGSALPEPLTDVDRRRPLRAADTAYVIFTSGSTGRPKGVAVTHEAITTNLRWRQERYRLTSADVVLHKTPVTFDVSVWELFWPLQAGARLVVAAPGGHRDPRYLAELVRDRAVTVVHFVPSMLAVFAAEAELDSLTTLRYLFASGEALPPHIAVLVRELLPAVAVHNLYGPTEAAVDVTHHEVGDADVDSVPIGAPIADTDLLILDSALNWVPTGAQGELYLAGTQLARCYVARPDLTAERFVANPYGVPGERMYRTGDLVSRSRTDELEYLGRSDFQVKIRGLRVELGEIEATLTRQDGIAQAAVRVHGDDALGDRLVAYVRLRSGASWDEDALGAALAATLPNYMIPTTYCVLDEFPLTASGKLDRAALPAPEIPTTTEGGRPETATESVVATVFAEMLGRDRVGVDDDFFALGGNSLAAVRAASRISARLGRPLSVQDFFDAPTVSGIARLVDRTNAGDRFQMSPAVGPRPYPVPLAPAQTRLWILDRLDPGSALYNMPLVVRLTGDLDVGALQQAVGDLVERHEVLRTVYPEVDCAGTQLVLPVGAAQRAVPIEAVAADEVAIRIDALAAEGFDIAESAPVRTHLLRVADDDHVLVVVVHHIAGDGFSAGPLTRDLMRAYSARIAGDAPEGLPLPVQYVDYALWQRDRLGDVDDADSLIAAQLGYWRRELTGLQDRLELPTDRPRPAVPSQAGAAVPVEIPADVHRAVIDVARATGTTEFMVVHAALAVLLARLSGSTDIAVGTPSAGRGDANLDELVGMFVNTLVLRTPIDAAESFAQLLTRVRTIDLGAFDHQDVPFDCVVDDLVPTRSPAYHPMFQVMLAFQNLASTPLELPSLTVATMDIPTRRAKFDLQVTLAERFGDEREPDGIVGEIAYATDLFGEGTVAVFARRLVRILAEATADPDRAVGDHRLLDRAELGTVLGRWNSTDRQVPAVTVRRLLDAQTARTPHLQAVVDDENVLTYADFAARVHRLARRLIAAGVGPERAVVVVAPRSTELLVAVHAILHAGGVYVPVDPEQPYARTGRMLDAVRPVVVLVGAGVEYSGEDHAVPVMRIDDATDLSAAPLHDAELLAPLRPENTAYILFTSGSTGEPKGVAVPHRAVVNQVLWIADIFRISVADTVLWKTPATFDVSVWEMFAPLASGARVVVAAPDAHRDARQLADIIGRRAVTLTSFVPSMLSVFAATVPDPGLLRTLRAVAVAGEALPAATVASFRAVSRAAVHNLYGPTEFTVHATAALVPPLPYLASRPVPMGRPVWNTRAVVLDSRLHPVPVGVAGELYLSGVQEARGYHGRPDLTAERFVADRFGLPGSRLYRTGDYVRWTPEGQLLHLGRTDDQVKIRGVRIELGDIEAALLNRSEVAQAVVTVQHIPAGDRLVAYIVATSTDVDVTVLRGALVRVLPAHLVPDTIVVVDAFPVRESGKLDRAALPAPVVEAREFVAPGSDAEQLVADVFAAVLGVDAVGAQDDFFVLGGNSLTATQVAARLADVLAVEVTVRSLFDTRTVTGFATLLEDAVAQRNTGSLDASRGPVAGPRPDVLPLSWSQS